MGDWAMTSQILTLQVKEEQTRREETEATQRVRGNQEQTRVGCSYSRSQVCVLKPSCHLTNGAAFRGEAFVCSINSY